MARQRKDEMPTEFVDGYRLLGRRTVPCTTDPVLQRAYNEQAQSMLLSAFIHGLTGTPGKMFRISLPATASEALRIAVTVSQAELKELRYNAFYLHSEEAEISPAGRMGEPAVQHTGLSQQRLEVIPDASPVKQASVVPTDELALVTRRQEILCNVMSVMVLAILREIVQIGHNGGLIAECPETAEIKLGRPRP